jgi:hypothetical protein
MKVFLACGNGDIDMLKSAINSSKALKGYKPYVLVSYYYAGSKVEKMIPHMGDFILDSGAFTFMQNQKQKIDWDSYIEKYADFIKRNDVKKFFELDIDKIVGYEKVCQYRQKLESLTGKRCIPVWHKSRGYKEYCKLCNEYDYVAIGGLAIKDIKKSQYKYLPKLIKEAHKRGAKVHGLGFTDFKWLKKCHFDTVDSASWGIGGKFGTRYKLQNGQIKGIKKPDGTRLKNYKKLAVYNCIEWLKFQKYAEVNL